MTEITDALNAGDTVVTHTDPISVPGWTGTKGATFERPIMNYATLWQLKGSGSDL